MKRTNVSALLVNRIIALMTPAAREVTVGPRGRRRVALEATIDVRSALGLFLTKKRHVGRQLGADTGSCFTTIDVTLRPGRQRPSLRLFAISVA